MKRLLIGAAACVLAAPLAPLGAGAAPAAPPSFSATAADLADDPDGVVLASRPVTAKAYDLPLRAHAWQLLYRTEDRTGRPTATVTTLLVPDKAWTGPGARPLVSYQTAEDGVDTHCAPSVALTRGLRDGFTGSYSETGLVALLLARGWAVSVPDYEGPHSEFLVADVEGKGVLDGLRAARNFTPAGLRHAPLGIWGYSGGSFASVSAAQLQPTYAPELRLTALALGGLLGNIRSTIDAFSGSIAGGAIPMGINGFLRAYPLLHLAQYLSRSGRAKVAKESHDCLFEAVKRYPFLRTQDVAAYPTAFDARHVAAMLRANSPLYRRGAPRVATYWYHTVLDEFAPLAPAKATIRNFCRAGTLVQARLDLVGEHLTELATGAPGAVAFLAARFAGRPPINSCDRIRA